MRLFLWHPGAPNRHAVRLLLFCCILTTMLTSGLNTALVRAESNEATAVHASFGMEYAVPNGPRNLVAEAPGRIWYTAPDAGGIGFLEVISPPGASVIRYRTEFYGLGEMSQPYDLVYDNGVVWFTLRGIRALGRIDVVTREVKLYTLLSIGAAPTGIDIEPSGQLWIAQNNGRISRFDPATETFTEFLMPDELRQLARIEDIDYYNSRNIWFTMPDRNSIVSYDSVRDRFSEKPTGEVQPMGIKMTSDGNIWTTAYGSSRIGIFFASTLTTWLWYESPTAEGGPAKMLIFDEPHGVRHLWISEHKVGKIGRMQFQNGWIEVSKETLGPNIPAGNTWGIIRNSDGHIWVADTGRNLLYEILEPYIHKLYISKIATETTE